MHQCYWTQRGFSDMGHACASPGFTRMIVSRGRRLHRYATQLETQGSAWRTPGRAMADSLLGCQWLAAAAGLPRPAGRGGSVHRGRRLKGRGGRRGGPGPPSGPALVCTQRPAKAVLLGSLRPLRPGLGGIQ